MSNFMRSEMEREDNQDFSKLIEQRIFTQSVLGYCAHFDIPAQNQYNINFLHFKDFEGIYYKEKYLNEVLNSCLGDNPNESPKFPLKFIKALEDVLISKNNYQRIMLQMLHTIYNQQQRIKYQSVLLELHNNSTSHNEKRINDLKAIITHLNSYNQAKNHHTNPSCSNIAKEIKATTSLTKSKSPAQRSTAVSSQSSNIQKSSEAKKNNFNLDLTVVSRQLRKSLVPSVSHRQKSSPKTLSSQKRYLTPRTKFVSTTQSILICQTEGSIRDENRSTKGLCYSSRQHTPTSRVTESKISKEAKREGQPSHIETHKSLKTTTDKAHKRQRNMSCGLLVRSFDEKSIENGSETSRELMNTEKSDVESKIKKLLEIPSIQEDTHDHEYDSLNANRPRSNEKAEISESSCYSQSREETHKTWKELRRDKNNAEVAISTQNKSISFQSSTGNLFNEIDNNGAYLKEDMILRDVRNCQVRSGTSWPRHISVLDLDSKSSGRGWDLIENNIVTSPSFGTQTVVDRGYGENSKANTESKNGIKTERIETKDNDSVSIKKVYGRTTSALKKKNWTPLFSKKN